MAVEVQAYKNSFRKDVTSTIPSYGFINPYKNTKKYYVKMNNLQLIINLKKYNEMAQGERHSQHVISK